MCIRRGKRIAAAQYPAIDRQTTTRVTLELADGQKVVCDQEGLGDNPWADDVIRELQA